MNAAIPVALITGSALVAIAGGLDCMARRNLRRGHAADPRDERYLCENLACTRHGRHRGPCNQDGAW